MQDKHGKDGLVVLTVMLDDPKDVKVRASAEKYLATKLFKDRAPPFRTLNLDANPDKLPPTLNFSGFPGAFVFNRDNRYVKKLPLLDAKGEPIEEFDYDKIDRAVTEALQKK
jgi:hypothetical protein